MNGLLHWRAHAWLALPLRLYLGAVFLCACWHKIAHPAAFALDVATYDLLPLALVNPLAIVLPWVELIAGALLVLGWRTRAAALSISAMMVVFLIAVSWALARGLETSCGCFASQSLAADPIGATTVLRDLAWLLGGLYVLFFDRRPLGIDGLLAARAARRG